MRRLAPAVVAACLVLAASAAEARPPAAAVDRGRLSLAWDAHESALYREALGYLGEIPDRSPVAPDAAWLRAECLYDLGRHREAVEVLLGDAARSLEDREAFLFDVFWDWAWEETGRGDYAAAAAVLERGLGALPGDPDLRALAAANRFRADLAGALAAGEEALPSGERLSVRPGATPPPGAGWHPVFPWRGEEPWVPEVTATAWMAGEADRLSREGRALWVRVDAAALLRALEGEARREDLRLWRSPGAVFLAAEGEEVWVDPEEWAYRAAAEGLGVEGAAVAAVGRAWRELADRAALAAWVGAEARGVEADRTGTGFRLRGPETGRTFHLDLGAWGSLFREDPAAWEAFWSDLRAELARPARPYRCFCGREVALREVLLPDPGEALPLEKGRGYAVVLLALCPLHQRYVTAPLLEEWGVGAAEARRRAARDGRERGWEVVFDRREEGGTSHLTLEGEGVSGLARHPALLLGALEAADGIRARSRALRVVAPSTTSLVVSDAGAPPSAVEAVAASVLLEAARRGETVERVDYRTTIRLPSRGEGAFRLIPAAP